ncbi:MAG TPA: hypothetical protein VG710_15950 [Opitutus sp.]|nr:hypothetical protein [Opitutus sp.]
MPFRRRPVFRLLSAGALAIAGCQAPSGPSPVQSPARSTAPTSIRSALEADNVDAAIALAKARAAGDDASAAFVLAFLQDVGAGVRLDHDAALPLLEHPRPLVGAHR